MKGIQKIGPVFRFGYADLIWTEAKDEEYYQPGQPASRKCPLSLTEMRTRMIEEAEADSDG
jgi:hypothetical protein